jgi:uncharacterized protein YdeI (BOF family)
MEPAMTDHPHPAPRPAVARIRWTGPLLAAIATLSAQVAAAETVTPIAEVDRGMTVTLRGTVDRITDDDEFRLVDASGAILVYVGPNAVPATTGETVTVRGRVDDDPGPLELYADSLTRADGSLVSFDHSYQ